MPRHFRSFVALALVVLASGLLAGPAAADERVRILSADDAVLGPAAAPATKIVGPVQGCQVLLDAGTGDCAFVTGEASGFAFTVEPGPRIDDVLASRPWTVRVYRPSPSVTDGWDLVLEAPATEGYTGALFAEVTARVTDVTGDDSPELLLGYRSEGTGQILDVDVVGMDAAGVPAVLAHDEVYKGSVLLRGQRLVTFRPVYRRADGNCCPTWIVRDVVRFDDGEFRVRPGARVPSDEVEVPPSDLG